MDLSRYAKTIATALLGLGLFALAAAIVYTNAGTNKAAKPPSPPVTSGSVFVVDGVTVVKLDPAVQRRSGIVVEPLAATTHRGETTVFGAVIDLQPLIDLRGRHEAANVSARATREAAAASRIEFERSRLLHQDNQNVSLKALQSAQASYRSDQFKTDAAALLLRNIEAEATQRFGVTLGGWGLAGASKVFDRLLAHQDVVVRLTFPPGFARAPETIEVQAAGGARQQARWISAAAHVAPDMLGTSELYRVALPLPVGAPVVAYLPQSGQTMPATFVPSSAVVWYAGQRWVYVQNDASRFARRPLLQATEADGGFVVSQALKPGERVVLQGAGLLLSEEQRPMPGGAGCKDPECD